MKNILKLSLLSIFILFLNCSEDEEPKTTTLTNATIELKNTNNQPVPNIVVYTYSESAWTVLGDNPIHANGQSSSNSEGKAVFSNLEYPAVFNEINNNQQTFRFSAHYTLNGANKRKVIAITFNKGDSKTGSIILD